MNSRYALTISLILCLVFSAAIRAEEIQDEITNSRVNAIVRAARTVGPAVVSVSVLQTRLYTSQPLPDFYGDPTIRDFFEEFFTPRVYRERIYSLGSGVIIRPEGYILTNEHLVRGSEQIRVTLPDGRAMEGELVDTDPYLDLAVITVEGEDLPVAPLGDSDRLIIGEWAIAIGNPFGYLLDDPQPTVTVGVISALNRAIRTGERSVALYRNMIQTDAAINPGNSGGPLVNADGEVIGINTFIFTSGGGSEGIGFARPILDAKRLLDDVVRFGRIRKPWIGAHTQSMNQEIAGAIGLESPTGVIVVQVDSDSPAHRAGVRRGDVIREANSIEIRDELDWETFILGVHVDDQLKLGLVRNGKDMSTSFRVEEAREGR